MTKFIQNLAEQTQSVLQESLVDDAAKLTGIDKDVIDDAVKGLSFANYLELGNAIDIDDADTTKEILNVTGQAKTEFPPTLDETLGDEDQKLLRYYATKHPGPYDDELDREAYQDRDAARLSYFKRHFPAPYDHELEEEGNVVDFKQAEEDRRRRNWEATMKWGQEIGMLNPNDPVSEFDPKRIEKCYICSSTSRYGHTPGCEFAPKNLPPQTGVHQLGEDEANYDPTQTCQLCSGQGYDRHGNTCKQCGGQGRTTLDGEYIDDENAYPAYGMPSDETLDEADNPSEPAKATPVQPAVIPPSAGSSIKALAQPADTAQNIDNQEMSQGRKEVDDLQIGDEIEVADIDGQPAAGRVRNMHGPGDTIVITGKGDEEHIIRKDSILSTPLIPVQEEVKIMHFNKRTKQVKQKQKNISEAIASVQIDKQSDWLAYANKHGYEVTEKYGEIGTELQARDHGELIGAWQKLLVGSTGWFRYTKKEVSENEVILDLDEMKANLEKALNEELQESPLKAFRRILQDAGIKTVRAYNDKNVGNRKLRIYTGGGLKNQSVEELEKIVRNGMENAGYQVRKVLVSFGSKYPGDRDYSQPQSGRFGFEANVLPNVVVWLEGNPVSGRYQTELGEDMATHVNVEYRDPDGDFIVVHAPPAGYWPIGKGVYSNKIDRVTFDNLDDAIDHAGQSISGFEYELNEVAPPGMEDWITKRKPEFKDRYGDRWEEVLYATAWKQHNQNESIEESFDIYLSKGTEAGPKVASVEKVTKDILSKLAKKHNVNVGDLEWYKTDKLEEGFDKHQKKIAIDTVKNPLKGKFLGGPSAEEAEETLRNKFGYDDKKIKKLKEGRFEVDTDQLKRILSAYKKFNKRGWKEDRIESIIVNMNQNLTNYALSQAFKKLGILLDPELTTHKRAAKYAAKKGLNEDWGSSDWYYAIESFLDDLDSYDTIAEAAYETALHYNDDRRFANDPWSHFSPRDLVWMAMQRRQIPGSLKAEAQAILNDEYTGSLRHEMANEAIDHKGSINEEALHFFVEPLANGIYEVRNDRGDIHDVYDSGKKAREVAAELNAEYGQIEESHQDEVGRKLEIGSHVTGPNGQSGEVRKFVTWGGKRRAKVRFFGSGQSGQEFFHVNVDNENRILSVNEDKDISRMKKLAGINETNGGGSGGGGSGGGGAGSGAGPGTGGGAGPGTGTGGGVFGGPGGAGGSAEGGGSSSSRGHGPLGIGTWSGKKKKKKKKKDQWGFGDSIYEGQSTETSRMKELAGIGEGYGDFFQAPRRNLKSGVFKSKAIGNTVKIVGPTDFDKDEHRGEIGVITNARREPTFSQMRPFVIMYSVKLESGEKVYIRRENIRKVKQINEAKDMVVKYQGRVIGTVWQEADGEWHGEHSGTGMSWATDNRKDMFSRIKDHELEILGETASGGATGAGAIASSPVALGGMQSRKASIYGQTKLYKKPEPKKRPTREEAGEGIGRDKKE